MTVPNRAKSVPTGTRANLERGEMCQGICLPQEVRSRNTVLKRSDPVLSLPRQIPQRLDKELPVRWKVLP